MPVDRAGLPGCHVPVPQRSASGDLQHGNKGLHRCLHLATSFPHKNEVNEVFLFFLFPHACRAHTVPTGVLRTRGSRATALRCHARTQPASVRTVIRTPLQPQQRCSTGSRRYTSAATAAAPKPRASVTHAPFNETPRTDATSCRCRAAGPVASPLSLTLQSRTLLRRVRMSAAMY